MGDERPRQALGLSRSESAPRRWRGVARSGEESGAASRRGGRQPAARRRRRVARRPESRTAGAGQSGLWLGARRNGRSRSLAARLAVLLAVPLGGTEVLDGLGPRGTRLRGSQRPLPSTHPRIDAGAGLPLCQRRASYATPDICAGDVAIAIVACQPPEMPTTGPLSALCPGRTRRYPTGRNSMPLPSPLSTQTVTPSPRHPTDIGRQRTSAYCPMYSCGRFAQARRRLSLGRESRSVVPWSANPGSRLSADRPARDIARSPLFICVRLCGNTGAGRVCPSTAESSARH